MDSISNITPIHFWCNKILPLVYDDSLSYYEVLCKIQDKMNEVIMATNDIATGEDQRIEIFDENEKQRQTDFQTQLGEQAATFTASENARAEAFRTQLNQQLTEFNALKAQVDEIITNDEGWKTSTLAAFQKQYDEFLENYQKQFGVVQEKGFSTTDVMSQNASTTEFNLTAKTAEHDNDELSNTVYVTEIGENKYNPALQTNSTISTDAILLDGTETEREGFNSTDFFPIKGSTIYRIQLVPSYESYTLPWGSAHDLGIAFYDVEKNFISATTAQMFPSPALARYARFNYSVGEGITLSVVNSSFMLTERTVPTAYSGYTSPISSSDHFKIFYQASEGQYFFNSRYNPDYDISFGFSKAGVNQLTDFTSVYLQKSSYPSISKATAPPMVASLRLFDSPTVNWHSNYIVESFAGGGDLSAVTSTGGKNIAVTGTSYPTAKEVYFEVYSDGIPVSSGSGLCDTIEIRACNEVMAYNTMKIDGTGRYVLREYIHMIFDGIKWKNTTTIVALEKIRIRNWYGLTFNDLGQYGFTNFIGASNRNRVTSNTSNSSGDATANGGVAYSATNSIELLCDRDYDLGRSTYYVGTSGVFTSNSHLSLWLLSYTGSTTTDFTLEENGSCGMRGSWRFYHLNRFLTDRQEERS